MDVRIYRICKDNPLPNQANKGDAGYDVYASEDVIFESYETKLVPLGIIAEAPFGYHFKLCLRSSMALKKGFRIANSVGIIDFSFCGEKDEMKIMLENIRDYGNSISKGDRVGQLILEKNNTIHWIEQDNRNFAGKSRGGFGSSGR